MDLGLGRWIYMVLIRHSSRIDISLLQHQSTSTLKRSMEDCSRASVETAGPFSAV